MAGVTVFVSTDIALQGADLVSGGQVANVKKGVELFLLNNVYVAGGPAVPIRGQSDVTALLRQGLDFLSKSPHETLGVPVGCRTPEIRKAYKKHALKYHPDKNPLTTPLFQLMSSAHDRLTDPTQRQKEERTAAAKNPKPKPAPPPPAGPAPTPAAANAGYSAAGGRPNPHPSAANPAPHPRPTYDPKTNKWSAEAEWGKYQQAPAGGPGGNQDASAKAQEAARRKQYYDDILREQFRKAESDRKAREYAAMREAATRQSAGSSAGNTPAGSGKSTDASGNPSSYYYNYANPNMKKPGQESASSAYSSRPVPPSDTAAGSAYAGAGANRSYKPATGDAKVNPQNVPLYGKIPSREAPYGGFSNPNSARRGSRDSNDPGPGRTDPKPAPKPTPTPNPAPSANSRNNSAAPSTAKSSGTSSGIAGNDPAASANNSSYNNLRSGVKPNASRVPRPYGLRCLFVGTNAAELEWVTSKYHRNSLLAELSWRIKDASSDLNASFRATWESAGKLISSGKCRKKNLVPGAIYEFRVRAVEELAGGLLGYRSDWSDSITITLLPDKTTYSNPTAGQSSPSLKGMAKSNSKGSAAFFADSGPAQPKTTTEPEPSAKPTQQAAAKPSFERFGTNAKRAEPRVNIYDQLNSNGGGLSSAAKVETTAAAASDGHKSTSSLPPKSSAHDAKSTADASADGRKSTSALPPRSNVYDTTAAEKVSTPSRQQGGNAKTPLRKEAGRTDSPLAGVTQINIDNAKRNPINGLGGSGRNVWGPDSITPDGSRNNTAKGKGATAKSADATSSTAAAKEKEKKRQETDRDRELEVEEDLADDNRSVEAAEVEDEVSAVGVDEDSKSIASPGPAKNSKPAQPTGKAGESRSAAATPDRRPAKTLQSGGAGAASKGEFADFTIEVEEGSDSEVSEEEDEDDFEVEYEEVYTLSAPPSKVKVAKKSSSNNLGLYAHPVRAEPVLKSTIVGYLTLGTDVVACADAGNWLKVKIHKQPTRRVNKPGEDEPEWGWSIRADKNHEYLQLNREVLPPLHVPPLSHASHNKSHSHYSTESPAAMKTGSTNPNSKSGYFTPTTPLTDKSASSSSNPLGNRSMRALPKYPNSSPIPTPNPAASTRAVQDDKNVPVWMELFDENGHAYYFNEATSESQWEPPDWVEERDPTSGTKYYVNLGNASADPSAPLHSTWTKPKQFARLLRT